MKRLGFILISLLFLNGCAGMLAHRSFIDEMDRDSDPLFVAGEDFPVTVGDEGDPYRSDQEIQARTPASSMSRKELEREMALRRELRDKEKRLSLNEQRYYRKAAPYFESRSERIYYLNLKPYERKEYLKSRGLNDEEMGLSSRNPLSSLRDRYQDREISLGMSKNDVITRWGRPARVDVAGNPRHENERWAFYTNGRVRYVYFEGGEVQGWQLQ